MRGSATGMSDEMRGSEPLHCRARGGVGCQADAAPPMQQTTAEPDILDSLRAVWRCRRCECPDCRSGYENHSHACTDGPGCVETRARMRARRPAEAITASRAADEIRRLRQEAEALRARVAQLEGIEHG